MDTAELERAKSFLGNPVLPSFTDEMLKVRRNLLILAFIAIAYKLSGAQIDTFNPIGINFGKVQPNFIDEGFFVLVAYAWIHFLWYSLDAYVEWRIRLTGTWHYSRNSGFGNDYEDYVEDPRQSTLMNWWWRRATDLRDYRKTITETQELAPKLLEKISKTKLGTVAEVNELSGIAKAIQINLAHLGSHCANADKVLESARIPVSLERFEKWYFHFQYSQLARWLILEWGMPIVLGCIALVMLFPLEWAIAILSLFD